MKQQKYTICVSLSFIVVSLAVYFIGAFRCFYGNEIVKDIFIAIFSSAFFVFFLSIIGYKIEKQHVKTQIINSEFLYGLEELADNVLYNSATHNCLIFQNNLKIVLTSLLNKLSAMRSSLVEYYEGLFKKDKELKSLINNDILNFAKLLYDLKSYNLEQQFKANILQFRINEMIKQHENLADKITNWMERNKFILGTPFVFDREQYELTTLDLIEKAKKAESD